MSLSHLILPGTTLRISRLALGTANLGVRQTDAEAFALLDHFAARGGRLLDTARVYSDWVPGEPGRSERIIGDWLRGRPGLSDSIVVGTKGLHYAWGAPLQSRVTAADARRDIEQSLRVLGLECLPLYWLHRDDPARPVEEIVEFMQAFVREGKVRHLGAANWTGPRLIAANAYAARAGLTGFVANQPLYNIGCWDLRPAADPSLVDLDRPTYDHHRRTRLPLMPYSPQAQGFFTHLANGTKPEKVGLSRYATPRNLGLAPVIAALARAQSCSVNAIVLAYLFHQPFPVVPIIGSLTMEQIDDSMAAENVVLSRDELQQLEDAAGSGISH
jgi:aryl-alcohol dehydrogenase-like predicted oxidoreductase